MFSIQKKSKGFTLIELLVVIAIIGILASVVLASLNSARTKGNDAAIRSSLASIRSQAAIIYDNDGDFDAVCGANGVTQDSKIAAMISNIQSNNNNGFTPCAKPSSGVANEWAVAGVLRSGSKFCIDSNANTVMKTYSSTFSVTGASNSALTDATDTTCN